MKKELLPYQLILATVTVSVGGIAALLGELRDEFSFSNAEVGLIVSAGFIAAFIAQILLAPLADRGRSRAMAVTGLALTTLALAAMVFAQSIEIWVGARALLGFASGLVLPGMRRAASVLDPEKVGENLGHLVTGEIVGFMVGPVIAAGLAGVGGIRTPFAALALISALFLPFAHRLPSDRGSLDTKRFHSFDLLKNRRLNGALLLVGAYFVLIGAFESVIPIMLRDRGATTLTTGIAFAVLGVPVALTAPFGGRLADRLGPPLVATAGIAAIAASTAAYGFIPGVNLLVLTMFLAGAADGIGFTAAQAAVSRSVPEARQAGALGLMGATEVGAAGLSAIPSAVAYDQLGDEQAWLLISASALIVLGISRLFLRGTSPVLRS